MRTSNCGWSTKAFELASGSRQKALKPRSTIHGVYEELDHVVGKGGTNPRQQVDVLLAGTPTPLNPGYLFFNGLGSRPNCDSACCRDDEWDTRNGRLGLTFTTAAHVRDALDTARFPKRLETILPRSVPLPCLATCIAPTVTGQDFLREILLDSVDFPQSSLVGDFFARIPGWVLDALRESAPLWVVTRESQALAPLVELLEGLGVAVRLDEGASTDYVDLALELDWPQRMSDRLPGRDMQGPLVVVDLRETSQ